MASSAVLYTPQVLALAAGLAAYPFTSDLTLRGAARAPTCGSTLDLRLALDSAGVITAIGLRAHACAIGQAAAAIFAGVAPGLTRAEIAAAETAIGRWLGGLGELPTWAGLEAIAAARDYPARHGAVLLAWRAALDALPSD